MNTDSKTNYLPHYQQEIFELISWLEEKLEEIQMSKDLQQTACISRCFLLTIFDLMRGSFGALEKRSLTGFRTIFRSIIEHVVDQRMIAISDDKSLNHRFANYSKISLYRIRKYLDKYKDRVAQIESEYFDYILRNFQEELSEHVFKNSVMITSDFKKIDEYILRTYGGSWSGLSFEKRISYIIQASKDSASKAANDAEPQVDIFIELLPFIWRSHCTYTHPTPQSTIPHFAPMKGSFEFAYNFTDDSLREHEKRCLLVLEYCVESFSLSYNYNFYKAFCKKMISFDRIRNYVEELLESNESRLSH